MATYIIKVKNTSGAEGTVIANAGFSYTDKLNEMNEGQLKISGTGEVKRSLFEIGSEVHIYRNGTLEFHGLINSLSYLDAGGIAADLVGYDIWLGKENGDYSNSPYSSTASATIASHIIGESTKFSSGTIEAGENLDFRIEKTSSLWNALSSLIKRTAQDIGIDYANTEVNILDHKGSLTSVITFNDSVQIKDLTVRQSYPVANDVRVYGQSEGETRIKSNTSYGQDATSKSTYGTIRKIYDDPSVTTENEANILADKLVAKWKGPVRVYEFDVINPNRDLESGDVITLNSSTKGLSNEEVRIVAIDRGIRNSQEFLTLQVTNKEYSTVERGVNKLIAELEKRANDLQTYDQYQDEYSNQSISTSIAGADFDISGWDIDFKGYSLSYVRQIATDTALTIGTTGAYNIYLWPGIGGFVSLGAHIDGVNNYRLKNCPNPVSNQDVATKYYVDTYGGGDNLGNHSATQDLDMNGYDITDITYLQGQGSLTLWSPAGYSINVWPSNGTLAADFEIYGNIDMNNNQIYGIGKFKLPVGTNLY